MKQTSPPTLLGKAIAVVAAIAILGVALMFSIIFFAIALTVGLIFGARIWWKTRELRKRGGPAPSAGGRVIEGEVIRDTRQDREER
jgi:hypothetical protein